VPCKRRRGGRAVEGVVVKNGQGGVKKIEGGRKNYGTYEERGRSDKIKK